MDQRWIRFHIIYDTIEHLACVKDPYLKYRIIDLSPNNVQTMDYNYSSKVGQQYVFNKSLAIVASDELTPKRDRPRVGINPQD